MLKYDVFKIKILYKQQVVVFFFWFVYLPFIEGSKQNDFKAQKNPLTTKE